MNGQDLKLNRERLNLSKRVFASLFGLQNELALEKLESDEVPLSESEKEILLALSDLPTDRAQQLILKLVSDSE